MRLTVDNGPGYQPRTFSTLERVSGPDRAPDGPFSDNGPRGRGGDQAEDRALHEQDRARHSGKPVGLAGDKRSAMS